MQLVFLKYYSATLGIIAGIVTGGAVAGASVAIIYIFIKGLLNLP